MKVTNLFNFGEIMFHKKLFKKLFYLSLFLFITNYCLFAATQKPKQIEFKNNYSGIFIEFENSILPNVQTTMFFSDIANLQELADCMYSRCTYLENKLKENDINFNNIICTNISEFNSQFVFNYNKKILYVPVHYLDILYIKDKWENKNLSDLLEIPEAINYLYYNGYISKNSNGTYSENIIRRLGESYSHFISDGQIIEYFKEDSIPIKYIDNNLQISSSILNDYSYKSFFIDDWLVSTKYDKFNDSPIYSISNSTGAYTDNANCWINIREKNKQLEFYISFSTNINLKEPIKFSYRIDSNEAIINEIWTPSLDGHAAFYPSNVEAFINKLMKGNNIIFETKDRYGKTIGFEINLIGLKEAFDKSPILIN